MAKLNLNQLTLRDKIHEAAKRSQDMTEHLNQGFLPKVHSLKKLTLSPDPNSTVPPVADITIRTQSATVLESDRYTESLDIDATQLFDAISTEIAALIKRGT